MVSLALFLVGGWGLGRDIGSRASLARAEAQATALAREAERAQLLALRSHLDPHFLFNTLNAIAEWCRRTARWPSARCCGCRPCCAPCWTACAPPTWPLADELALLDTLFELHLLRDPERFALAAAARAAARRPVPPMLLLPLAENAVKHGPAAGHRGTIRSRCARSPAENTDGVDRQPGRVPRPPPGGDGLDSSSGGWRSPTTGGRGDIAAAATRGGRVMLPLAPLPPWVPHVSADATNRCACWSRTTRRSRASAWCACWPRCPTWRSRANAPTAHEVLDRVRAGGVDAVLLDIQMPGLTGLDAPPCSR